MAPAEVCRIINDKFPDDVEYLEVVQTKDFSTFYRYFSNRGMLSLIGLARYGLTWGHLFLYGSQDDLYDTFRGGRHHFDKRDPATEMHCRWEYLFDTVSMQKMAHDLTRYWLPLTVVIVAVRRVYQSEVSDFLNSVYAL